MKIAFFEIENWEKEIIEKELNDHELFFFDKKISELEKINENDFDVIAIFINSIINEKTLQHFKNLKFITTRSTGFDHIDLKTCKEKNILVSYVPGYGDNTVAEFTFGLILNLTRKIYQSIDQIKETGFFNVNLKELKGIDLKNKTLGVVGTGRIGKEVIKIANGFSMNVIAYDIYPDENLENRLNFKYVTFEELLKNSDIITLHCPYNEKTHHLINKNNIFQIKKGAYLINTARGGLIETEALLIGLEEKIIAGAGLDVLEEEGEIKDELKYLTNNQEESKKFKTILENHILLRFPNVLITPHNAFNSKEALERILYITILNIKNFINNTPINLIN